MRVLLLLLLCPLPAFAEMNITRLTFTSFEKGQNFSSTFGNEFRFLGEEKAFTPLFRLTSVTDYTFQKPQHVATEMRLQPGFRYKNEHGLHSFLIGYSHYRDVYTRKALSKKLEGAAYSYNGWLNGPKNSSLAVNLNYLPHLNRVEAFVSPGIRWNLHEYFAPIVGVEMKYTTATDYKAKRIGVFVGDFGFPNFRVKLNSGVTFTEGKPNDAYVGFAFWFHSSKYKELPLPY